jgi:hypothetical protein
MAPTTRIELVAAIGVIADQIDHRHGNPPGTALRGIYMWYWPAAGCEIDTLTALHRDAVELLAATQADEPTPMGVNPIVVADRECACGRPILNDTEPACDRCTPIVNGPQRHNGNTETA